MTVRTEIDEFDSAPGVGGKHLAPKGPLNFIASFLTLTLISMLLAGGGVAGLRLIDAAAVTESAVVQEEPIIETGLPTDEIAIVDATNTLGLSTRISEELKALGWNVVADTSLSEQDASLPTSPTTLIFISSEAYQSLGLALQAEFPEATIGVSSQFEYPATVMIGNDYLKN